MRGAGWKPGPFQGVAPGMPHAASQRRDLREGRPVWNPSPKLPPPDMLAESESAHIVVIGGGISGALMTDALLAAGHGVLALDRQRFVAGSTMASTAMLQFEMDEPLSALTRKIGREAAIRAYWRSTQAMDRLRARIEDLDIRCGFQPRHSAYLPGRAMNMTALQKEAARRRAAGLRSRFVGREELRELTGLEEAGAIWSTGSAEVDPVRLTAGLWRSAAARGARLAWPVEVEEVRPRMRGVTLHCTGGRVIRAKHVVFCCGYAAPDFLKLERNSVISTWAMATRPQPEALWPDRCLIWRAEDPYLYVRADADGRVIAGGEDEPFVDDDRREAATEAKIARLVEKLRRLLPGIDPEPSHVWSGCFGVSTTGLPAIGAVPGLPRCYALLGFGGNGITFSTLGAEIIQRLIDGMPEPDAGLYALRE
ncbi:FAD-binding oxidoreductase [Rhodovarius crocodyli]|uniref:FAD-binding oxidoreductase n=2 Tax=Rhodovarius crocodyli TaxID=1979269 RepID=A0A437MG31_9PROT|nr:FAD-binding oxidoreductase [Rhodovarius crocodyli]